MFLLPDKSVCVMSRFVFLHQLHQDIQDTSLLPTIPLADISDLSAPKVSALTRTLASCSPSAISLSLIPGRHLRLPALRQRKPELIFLKSPFLYYR